MPLVAAGLSAAIKSELDSRNPIGSTDDGAMNGVTERQEFCDAIAAAVISYLKTSTVVTVTTACGAGAGTGQGTIS